MQQQPSGPLPLRIESAAYQGTYDLTRFTLADMVRCGGALRHLAAESASMEEAAQKVTQFLYKHLLDRTSNDRECVLVRFFKSHSYGGLSNELRQFADSIAERAELPADTKCLVLLGTTGDEARWNSRRMSVAHQAIPLTSEAVVEQSPMIVHLIHQLGLTTAGLLHATPPMIRDLERKSYGIFHVAQAADSPYVPAQKDFVVPYGIVSVLGFGGFLPDGNLFAVIIFARVPTSPSVAEMFRTVALNLKLGLLALSDKPVFVD